MTCQSFGLLSGLASPKDAMPTGEQGFRFPRWPVWLLLGYFLLAHGCHGSHDDADLSFLPWPISMLKSQSQEP